MRRESAVAAEDWEDDLSTDLPSAEIELRLKSNWNMGSSSDSDGFIIRNSLCNPGHGTKRGGKKAGATWDDGSSTDLLAPAAEVDRRIKSDWNMSSSYFYHN